MKRREKTSRAARWAAAGLLLAGLLTAGNAWAQLPVTDGLTVWLKADAGVTLNGSTVSAWNDQSGAGRNATQGTTAKQPLYVASADNGKPSVLFDGTDDQLLWTAAPAQTIFAATRPSSAGVKMYCRAHWRR